MAQNQHINKVVFGSATLVDLTGTTAAADKILQGYGAYGADGAWMDGTAEAGGGGSAVSFSISVTGDAVIYYVDDSGTPTESQFMVAGGTVSGSGLGNSLACVLCSSLPTSTTNLQFYKQISLGSRASYRYARIYQVSDL